MTSAVFIDNDVVRKRKRLGMSNIGWVLKATGNNGVVAIGTDNSSTKITFLGASCLASVKPGTHELTSVTLSPVVGQNAVVALMAYYSTGKGAITVCDSILELVWEDGKLFVDKDKSFVSSADRLGQIIPRTCDIQVTTGGQVFSTCFDNWRGSSEQYFNKKKEDLQKSGVRTVTDANLLCRYLVGQATLTEVEVSATGDVRTAEQIKFNMLQAALCEMGEKVLRIQDELIRERRKSAADVELLSERNSQLFELNEKLRIMTNNRDVLKGQFDRAIEMLDDKTKSCDALQARLNRVLSIRIKNWWNSLWSEKPGCSRRKGC